MTKRRIISQLPGVLQTEPLQKLLGATADHLFQPGTGEALSGYIGRRDLSYFDIERDFYIPESVPAREAYQLDTAMVSFADDGTLTHSLFYEDVVNYLRSQGAIVNDHNRLFEGERYSWAPPIDIDKLMNYSLYYWFGDNPYLQPAVILSAPKATYTGDGVTTTFALPPSAGLAAGDEMVVVYVGENSAAIASRTTSNVTLTAAPAAGAAVVIFRHGDLRRAIEGNVTFDASPINTQGIGLLTNGMRVILLDALSEFDAWDRNGFDTTGWDRAEINDYYVEGVGTSIQLLDFSDMRDETNPVYVVMDRKCRDRNPWSRVNRWVHRDAISWNPVSYLDRRARRPIVEFIPDLKLWRYGTRRIDNIQATLNNISGVEYGWDESPWDPCYNCDVVDAKPIGSWDGSEGVRFLDINGELAGTIITREGTPLLDGQRVIVVDVEDNDLADSVYRVSIVDGRYLLVAEDRATGGEVVRINAPDSFTSDIEYYHDGRAWRAAQIRAASLTNPLLAPLFELYDGYGNSLADTGVYPESDFDGNFIFGYRLYSPEEAVSAPIDSVLGFAVRRDSGDQIEFEVYNVTDRAFYGDDATEITGHYYWRVVGDPDIYGNNWNAVDPTEPVTVTKPTRRYYRYAGGVASFPIPEVFIDAPVTVTVAGAELSPSEYAVAGNRVVLDADPAVGALVVLAFGGVGDIYTVPLNLRANPGNEEVEIISRGQWYEHFASLMTDHENFVGQPYSANNWRDIAHDMSLGDKILQHRAPLLKTMLLASDSRFDLPTAIQYVENEYSRFRARFLTRLSDLLARGVASEGDDPATWVELALDSLRQNRSSEFPFAVSGMAGDRYFVPATPAALGVFPVWRPVNTDDGIRGHDGSVTPFLGDFRDGVLLALEQRIYDSIPSAFKTESRPAFDLTLYMEGRFRGVPLFGYSRREFNLIMAPIFERWAQVRGLNYRDRLDFAEGDPFTWNYAACEDWQGRHLPGHWKGIYRFLFDTERPDLRPWEMLGFTEQPVWWEVEYGPAPYTLGNLTMWGDIQAGRIAQGPRAGIDPIYARPGLINVLPLDEDGVLLNPIQAGIVRAAPTIQDASAPWRPGDLGPVEQQWMRTPEYQFALARAAYLMKPARFVEICWDRLASQKVNGDQWVLADGWRARDDSDALVHGETADDGVTRARVWGVQQWVSDLMASRGQSASILGSAVRGLDVRLGYKVGGFTSADNLRVVADNFGIVPDEDIRIELYRSPSIRDEVFTGMIVEWTGNAWRVIGYDALDPNFTILPGDPNGPKSLIRLADTPERVITKWNPNTYYVVGVLVSYDNSVYEAKRSHTSTSTFEQVYWTARPGLAIPTAPRVTNYLRALGTTERVPYGAELRSKQDVADLILGLNRYQLSRGWRFEELLDGTEAGGWERAVRLFLQWSSEPLVPGSFISLSPGGTRLYFQTEHGTVLPAERMYRGVYGLLDRSGLPIDPRDTLVRRLDGSVSFASTAGEIYAARASVGEVEHVMLFSNETIFDDIIYQPLYDLRQPRLRVIGQRSRDWHGRYEAPGYVLVDGQIKPNFEKQAEDIRQAFDIERADNKNLREFARHIIGYQSRAYLRDIFLSDTQQFEFYQGMIQAKGVPGVFNKLVRSQFVDQNRNLKFFDEWAIKVAEYGARSLNERLSFVLRHSDIRRDPQFVSFRTPTPILPNPAPLGEDDWIEIVDPSATERSPLWVERARDGMQVFPHRLDYTPAPGALPTAGYARLTEVTGTAFDMAAMNARFDDTQPEGGFYLGDRWWVYVGPKGRWDVLRVCAIGDETNQGRISEVRNNAADPNVQYTRLYFYGPHGLTLDDIGSYAIVGSDPALDNVQGVREIMRVNVGQNWIEVAGALSSALEFDDLGTTNQGPRVFILRPLRFANRAEVDAAAPNLSLAEGDLVYVDGDGRTIPWTAQRWNGSEWVVARTQPRKIMSHRLSSALLYDLGTRVGDGQLSPEPLILNSFVLVDPVGGLIPGVADREITYKLDYDPAYYSNGLLASPDVTWGREQVGEVWWDTSRVRFIEAETDDVATDEPSLADRLRIEMRYRTENWARVAPGSTVDVYEWVESEVPPREWSRSNEGTPYGGDEFGFQWSESSEYDAERGSYRTYYYFWVKGRTTVPTTANRRLDITSVADIIENPANIREPWVAPVASNGLLIGGLTNWLDDDGTVVQLTVRRNENDGIVHQQWALMRDGDDRSLPADRLWSRLRDSLAGFDDRLRPIPSPLLHPSQRVGIVANQSLFGNGRQGMLDARRSFVTMVNLILARSNLSRDAMDALMGETPIGQYMIWVQSNAAEPLQPIPPRYNPETQAGVWHVEVSSIEERNALLFDPEVRARTTPLRVLLNGLENTVPQWSVWVLDESALATLSTWSGTDEELLARADDYPIQAAPGLFQLERNYDDPAHVVDTIAERDTLASIAPESGGLVDGERVLVRADAAFRGFWTIWRYNAADGTFALVATQSYRLSDFWEYADWYATDYEPTDEPVVRYATAEERDRTENPVEPENKLVRLDDDTSGSWVWTAWSDGSWQVVARQNSTVRFSDALYDEERVPYGFGEIDVEKISNRDGSWEIRFLADALRRTVLTDLEVNELLFSMLHFIHAQQDRVDWAFKTSFMTVSGFREPLRQTAVRTSDNTESLIAYIDEVKPYRVKMREFTRSLASDTDIGTGRATDFDKPPFYDSGLGAYRRLLPSNPADTADLNTLPWRDWFSNYQKESFDPSATNFNPVRRAKTTIKFDRVTANVSWGWDVSTFDAEGWDTGEPTTAADRIERYYDPLPGMREKNLLDLLDMEFQGTEYDAENLVNRSERDVDLDANGVPEVDAVGYGLRDPLVTRNHPDEAAGLGANVAVALHITDRPGNGAAPQASRIVHVSEATTDPTVTIGLPLIPQGGGAVAVFRDGYRAREGASYDFTSDLVSQTVTVKLVRNSQRVSRIAVHTFGPGATTAVVGLRFHVYQGGAASFTIPAEFIGMDVEVVVGGGRLTAAQYTVAGNTVTLSSLPSVGQDVILVFRLKDADNPSTNVRVEMRTQVLPYDASKTWTLAYPSGATFPHEATIADLNGRRLTPPDTLYASLEPMARTVLLRRAAAGSALRAYFNGVQYTVRDGNADGSLSAAIAASPVGTKFVVFGSEMAALDTSMNGEVVVVTLANHDYTVAQNGIFNFLGTLAPSDVLTVTTFVNASQMGIRTVVLDGGQVSYALRPPPRSDMAWMTYDGRRIEANEDFTFGAGGLVVRPDLPTIDAAPNYLVATIFYGTPVREIGDWMIHTRRPTDAIMTPVGEGRFAMPGAILATRLRPEFSGVLASDFASDAPTFVVTVGNPNIPTEMISDTPFPVPDLEANRPGVVWIGGERIEYFSLSVESGTATFGQLRRITHGTSRGETRIMGRFTASGFVATFTLVDAQTTSGLEVSIIRSVDGEYQPAEPMIAGIDYTVAMVGQDATVTFPTPPEAGTVVVIARSVPQFYPAGTIVYGGDTTDIDLAYVLNNGSTGNLGEPYDDYFFHTDGRGFAP